jgi:hypothetical protein
MIVKEIVKHLAENFTFCLIPLFFSHLTFLLTSFDLNQDGLLHVLVQRLHLGLRWKEEEKEEKDLDEVEEKKMKGGGGKE